MAEDHLEIGGNMEIEKAKIKWFEGKMNSPKLHCIVDEIPPRDEMVFEHRNRQLWFGELDGYVEFFAWSGPDNEGGFGGETYHVTLESGEEVALKGPWSSRASVMCKYFSPPCVDVRLAVDESVWERDYTWRGASISLPLACEAASMCDAEMVADVASNDEVRWMPSDGNHGVEYDRVATDAV